MADEVKTAEAPQDARPSTEHEFGEADNVLFADLASNLRLGGWGIIVVVVVYHLVLLVGWATDGKPPYDRFRFVYVWWPLVTVMLATVFIRAGRAFDRIVQTQGSDISHLRAGLGELNDFFSWLPGVWILLFFAGIAGAVAGVVHALGY